MIEYIPDNIDIESDSGINEGNCDSINEPIDDNSHFDSPNTVESITTNIGIDENWCNTIQEQGTLSTVMGESLYGDLHNVCGLDSHTVKNYQSIEEVSISPNADEMTQDVGLGSTIAPTSNTTLPPINELESAQSNLDIDNFANTPSSETLDVHEDDIARLQERAQGMERSEHKGEISFGKKMCPTRHGCQGATDCDYCGSDYPD